MSTLKLAVSAQPVELVLKYALSDTAIDDFIAETGKKPRLVASVQFSLTRIDPELRRRAAEIRLGVQQVYHEIEESPFTDEMDPRELYPILDAPTDEPAVAIAAWEAFLRDREERQKERAREKQLEEAVEKGKREAFRLEMARWITEHGSERLKTAFQRKYRVTGSYVRERAALEFPGFAVDLSDKAQWQVRANPSEHALDAETGALETLERISGWPAEVRIVWLTRDEHGRELGGKGEALPKREVVVVSNYLGFYDLIGDVKKAE